MEISSKYFEWCSFLTQYLPVRRAKTRHICSVNASYNYLLGGHK